MWTQVRLLLLEQSDLSLHCLLERLLKHFSRRQKLMNFIVIGALRVKLDPPENLSIEYSAPT